ncbi:TetR/AcrR family transcriptional regulator; helix-turn-helix transcriptional regulator [Mycobacterium intracellulare subsp. chimaera]|uniref:TetR/AcrR family transcriptional regulator n=1 Tax=Mycobacterium intracellulare TaxID=1767 RepID=UPI0004537E8A|nr:TetR/AcrR family transcriptional regulator [Mycobacterium intracellulare]ASL18879.1 TetR family transcriptional regulator [Mycobacterium intracellulare subsp. chimaera]ETZ38583.1 bacterial regulatory s, tetR family protein [Mycobacterium intracellulare MIN_052511_1280]UCN04442.1 TetR/AcrR family transcriptional regulator; helix-turn-helix transcriptional regulator [Mycobacterium intracellulare subsp. chimaera]
MERDALEFPVDDDDDVDPRRLRSRTRLLDAATTLLSAGGIEAVTIDAVTKASKVARTTLYRHFSSSTQLLAATFERLLPQVHPPPGTGPLRDQLIELLSRQATLFQEAPLHVTTLAWVALGPASNSSAQETYDRHALRTRIVDQYRQPFDRLLQSPKARADLDEFDPQLILCQLVGPLAFARLTGMRAIDRQDCERIVDDFLAAHRRHADEPATQAPSAKQLPAAAAPATRVWPIADHEIGNDR